LGTVIHSKVTIEDDVMIMSNATIGRSDVWIPLKESKFEGIVLKKGSIICTGAKILCKNVVLTVGENTIIGANAVLTCSTGNDEVWVGIPAKKIKTRDS
jgi:serine O-acetyltransferase